jgi:hypothetical protein
VLFVHGAFHVVIAGDRTFNPPKDGMPVFDHGNPAVREWWKSMCINATMTGNVDGCFSDSSQAHTHDTQNHLNAADDAKFEAGKVQTMTDLTVFFGGAAGKPYVGSHGVLIGKTVNQSGINAVQVRVPFSAEHALLGVRLSVLCAHAHAHGHGHAMRAQAQPLLGVVVTSISCLNLVQ